jgi:hypothetical protein
MPSEEVHAFVNDIVRNVGTSLLGRNEYHQIIVPQLIGSGNYWLPKDVKSELKLVDLRKFENGFVHLQYSKI